MPISPPQRFPALGPNPPKRHHQGSFFTWPWTISLHRRKARASEGPPDLRVPVFRGLGRFRCTGVQRERRRPPNMLKRKLRAPDGPQTLKNVSSNRSWPPLLVLGPSQGPPIAPGALSKAPSSHRGTLLEPSQAHLKRFRGPLLASCLPCRINKQGTANQHSPAGNPQPAITSQRHSRIQGRGPAAGGRRPLNPATEPFRAKGTAVAKRYVMVLSCPS